MKVSSINKLNSNFSRILTSDNIKSDSYQCKNSFEFPHYNKNLRYNLTFTGNKISSHRNKDTVYKEIIIPIDKSRKIYGSRITPIFMLCGDDKLTQKNINRIKGLLKGNVNYINLSDVNKENFIEEIYSILKKAKLDSLKSKKMTIIQIDNAERFLAINKFQANELLDYTPDKADMAFLNNNGENSNFINEMKSIADFCSVIPKDESSKGNATIFLLRSKYPHLIHPDLLTRQGKMKTVFVNDNSDKQVKYLLKKQAKTCEIKLNKLKNDYKKCLSEESIPLDVVQKIIKYKKNGRLNKICINPDKIPYDVITEFCKPSSETGEFSIDDIKKIFNNALNLYIVNPNKEFSIHLMRSFVESKRSISAETSNRNQYIKNLLSSESKEDGNVLRQLYLMDSLSERDLYKLAKNIFDDNTKKAILENKEELLEAEKNELEKLRELTKNDDEILNNDNINGPMSMYISERIIKINDNNFLLYYSNNDAIKINLKPPKILINTNGEVLKSIISKFIKFFKKDAFLNPQINC